MYRIYVGDFVKKGTPATWTLVYRSGHKPIKEAKEIGRKLKYEMEEKNVRNRQTGKTI